MTGSISKGNTKKKMFHIPGLFKISTANPGSAFEA